MMELYEQKLIFYEQSIAVACHPWKQGKQYIHYFSYFSCIYTTFSILSQEVEHSALFISRVLSNHITVLFDRRASLDDITSNKNYYIH